ncbi:uncharacterized protein LOC120625965 [Pararge aegeria]|uniref:uncharacterized protein LOC120625965 n=1 Tax=Pararge aegeria TaxID=116150 RepID=UPI0019D215B7|nr:uncharacterized protein LOC120625965 [Pararge aegeria]
MMDKSLSETNLDGICSKDTTPPNFTSLRYKRKRDEVGSADFRIFQEEMRDMIKSLFSVQEQELKKIAPTLKDIQQSYQNIEKTIAFLSAQNEEFKEKIFKLETQVKEDRTYIGVLEEKIEDLQRGSRKLNFEIKNVPKKSTETKEDLIAMVNCLSKCVGSSLTNANITDIYRVRGKREGITNTPIVVETSSTILKSDILRLCKMYNVKHKSKLCAKNLGFRTSEDTPIFVSDQLTPKGARLYFLARELVKTKAYRFCWTAFGKIHVRKDENSPIITIKDEAQISYLLRGA